jgi:hypothetical protein
MPAKCWACVPPKSINTGTATCEASATCVDKLWPPGPVLVGYTPLGHPGTLFGLAMLCKLAPPMGAEVCKVMQIRTGSRDVRHGKGMVSDGFTKRRSFRMCHTSVAQRLRTCWVLLCCDTPCITRKPDIYAGRNACKGKRQVVSVQSFVCCVPNRRSLLLLAGCDCLATCVTICFHTAAATTSTTRPLLHNAGNCCHEACGATAGGTNEQAKHKWQTEHVYPQDQQIRGEGS